MIKWLQSRDGAAPEAGVKEGCGVGLFRKKKKNPDEEPYAPPEQKAHPVGSGKLDPFEKLIIVLIFYALFRWFWR